MSQNPNRKEYDITYLASLFGRNGKKVAKVLQIVEELPNIYPALRKERQFVQIMEQLEGAATGMACFQNYIEHATDEDWRKLG